MFNRTISFLVVLSVIVFINFSSANSPDLVNTLKSKNNYYKLKFISSFYSDFLVYPDAENLERGTVLIYDNQSSSGLEKQVDLLPIPLSIKKKITDQQTLNPFREKYSYIYTKKNIDKFLKCPALGLSIEIDNDLSTSEWVITSSPFLCLSNKGRGVDSTPHIWVLQKYKNNKYRILVESDKSISIINPTRNKNSDYKQIKTELYLKQVNPDANECGGAYLNWQYKKGEGYRVIKKSYHVQDCDLGSSHGKMKKAYTEKHLKAIKPKVSTLLDTLKNNNMQEKYKTDGLNLNSFNSNEEKAIQILFGSE